MASKQVDVRSDRHTKSSERPAALIISDRWGSPFQGGIPVAVRLLARLIDSSGLSTYSTVLESTSAEANEAKSFNVNLISPNPRGSLKNDKPRRQWLLAHEAYFPNLDKIKKVEIIIGFAMITSEAALSVKKKVFPNALYHVVNLWATIESKSILGFDDIERFEEESRLSEEIDVASLVASIDHRAFQHFYMKLRRFSNKHFQILPIPNEKYFKWEPLQISGEHETFKILTILEQNDYTDMKTYKSMGAAMNLVAGNFHVMKRKPITWLILGVPKGKEKELQKILKPHSHLSFQQQVLPPLSNIERELYCTHLVVLPTYHGMNSHHIAQTTMAIGIPLLTSKLDPCSELIKEHFPEYEDDMIVDMTNPKDITAKILSILCKPEVSVKRTRLVKDKLGGEAKQFMEDLNSKFVEQVKQNVKSAKKPIDDVAVSSYSGKRSLSPSHVSSGDGTSSPTGHADKRIKPATDHVSLVNNTVNSSSSGHSSFVYSNGSNNSGSAEAPVQENDTENSVNGSFGGDYTSGTSSSLGIGSSVTTSRYQTGELGGRRPGQLRLRLNISGGIPSGEGSMEEVESAYYRLPEVVKETPERLNNIIQDITVGSLDDVNTTYALDCKTVAALEQVWSEYENSRLDTLITTITLTETTLERIGARYLSVHALLDFQEYVQCRMELLERESLSGEDDRYESCAEVEDDPGAGDNTEQDRLAAITSSMDDTGVALLESSANEPNFGEEDIGSSSDRMTLRVNISGGIPMEGRSMEDVENSFYDSSNLIRDTLKYLNGIHQDLKVINVDRKHIAYSLTCSTLDALECLWTEYESSRLQEMISAAITKRETLKALGAVHLSIQMTLDFQEYEQCRINLLRTGQIRLQLVITDCTPIEGHSKQDVESAYYRLPEVVEETLKQIDGIHQDISARYFDHTVVAYVLQCTSSDALECLWKAYKATNLDTIVTNTTITKKTLKEIGAVSLSIKTAVDFPEYMRESELLFKVEKKTLVDDDEQSPAKVDDTGSEKWMQHVFEQPKAVIQNLEKAIVCLKTTINAKDTESGLQSIGHDGTAGNSKSRDVDCKPSEKARREDIENAKFENNQKESCQEVEAHDGYKVRKTKEERGVKPLVIKETKAMTSDIIELGITVEEIKVVYMAKKKKVPTATLR